MSTPNVSANTPLHIQTPLIYSSVISSKTGCNVWLKLENCQPSGSFKTRGISAIALESYQKYGDKAHLVISSGGNAGLACAYAARMLNLKSTIVTPTSSPPAVRARLLQAGAEKVLVHGDAWDEADKLAREIVAKEETAIYVPPFDHPTVVQGNSTMITEIKQQFEKAVGNSETRPDGIICSVGGGGLLAGVLEGCDQVGWGDVPVAGVETFGAASLQASLLTSYSSDPPKPILAPSLENITSIATSLGAKRVSQDIIDRCVARRNNYSHFLIEDKRTLAMVEEFAADQQILVEPSCAGLAPFYTQSPQTHLSHLFPSSSSRLSKPQPATEQQLSSNSSSRRPDPSAPNFVVIVCGGSGVSFERMNQWKEKLGYKGRGEEGEEGLGKVEVWREGKNVY